MIKSKKSEMTQNVLRVFMVIAMTSAIILGTTRISAAAIELKFHHDLPEDSAQHLAAEKFKTAVESRTNGEIKVKIFPSNALGNDVEATQQMQFGAIQGGIIPTAKLSNFVPALQLIDLPFLFPSPAVAHKVLDSKTGDRLLATLDQVGLKGVTFWESGFKQFTCNHLIQEPSDFKGYKVRVMQSPIIMEQFKALGANPVPISFGETYNALQQHVVECEENPLVSITKMKFYEVQSNLIISNHAYLGYAFVFSKKWFDGLKPEYQKILVETAREMTSFEREETARREEGYLKTIRESGTIVTRLSPEQLVKFQEATRPVYKKFADQIGQNLLDAFYQEIKKDSK